MYALETRAPAEILVPRRAHRDLTEGRLRQFRPEISGPVKALARRHRRLADLAVSFPALLFALAHPRPRFDPEPAIRAVIEGRPLKDVARLAGVAFWLRELKPHMFTRALPALPDNTFLRRTIVNHLPRKAAQLPVWLETVAAAARDGTDEFAVWCARHLEERADKELASRLRTLALYAWYSAHPETKAHTRIVKPFHPTMTVKNAAVLAANWLFEVELDLYLGEGSLADVWYETAIVDGLEFLPLRSAQEIREEAKAMQNCLRNYGYSLATGWTRLFSIRKDGRPVATASLEWLSQAPMAALTQLKGPANVAPSEEVFLAARRWLLKLEPRKLVTREVSYDALFVRSAWQVIWKPYWLAKRRFPSWLPLGPSYDAMWSLQAGPPRRVRRRPAARRRNLLRVAVHA